MTVRTPFSFPRYQCYSTLAFIQKGEKVLLGTHLIYGRVVRADADDLQGVHLTLQSHITGSQNSKSLDRCECVSFGLAIGEGVLKIKQEVKGNLVILW
jgi:hypothetical protein